MRDPHQTGRGLHPRFGLAMVLAAACWGAGTVISRGVLGYLPPLTLLVVQLVASLTFLWALVAVRRTPVPLRRETLLLALPGVLNPGVAYTFSLLGLALTTASMAAILWAVEPILILGLAWLMLRERVSRSLLACSLLAIAGVFLVMGIGSSTGHGGSLAGNLLTLAGVLCCALYAVLIRRAATKLDPVLLVAVQQTAALAWALLIWPFEIRWGATASPATIGPNVWLWAVASGIVYYALAFWLYIVALRGMPASLAGLFINLTPIFAVGGATLFLGERWSTAQWVGAAVVLVAVVIMSWMQLHGPSASPRAETPRLPRSAVMFTPRR